MAEHKTTFELDSRKLSFNATGDDVEKEGPTDQATEAVQGLGALKETFFKDDELEISVGATSNHGYVGASYSKSTPDMQKEISGGIVLKDGKALPYVAGEVSTKFNVEAEGFDADVRLAATYIPDEAPYAIASAGLHYERPEGDDGRIHSADLEIMAGVHGDQPVAGAKLGVRTDLAELDDGKITYVFKEAATLYENDESILQAKLGLGVEIPMGGASLTLEAGGVYSTGEADLPSEAYDGIGDQEGAGAYIAAGISIPLP